MARSIKRGIDYFSLDVGIFADRKIRRVCHSHGSGAMAVVLRVLCCIYGENGYYADADDDFFFDIAHELSLEEAYVRAVISACVAAGFFDAAMLDAHAILTSRRIQRNYLDATRKRGNVVIEDAYRLAEDGTKAEETAFEAEETVIPAETSARKALSGVRSTQSKVNQIKGEERKEKESISKQTAARREAAPPSAGMPGSPAPDTPVTHTSSSFSPFIKPSADEVKAYCTERGNGVDAQRFVNFYESKGWMVGSSPMQDWRACVRKWEGDTYSLPGKPVYFAHPFENYDHLAEKLFPEKKEIEYKYSEVV